MDFFNHREIELEWTTYSGVQFLSLSYLESFGPFSLFALTGVGVRKLGSQRFPPFSFILFFLFFLRSKRKCCWRLVTVCLEVFQLFSWGHPLQALWETERKRTCSRNHFLHARRESASYSRVVMTRALQWLIAYPSPIHTRHTASCWLQDISLWPQICFCCFRFFV
jgi:hypothetical protein